MRWIIHLEGGPKRVNHAAVVIRDKIYSFGGYCSGEVRRRNEPLDVHVLNTDTYRWHRVSAAKPIAKESPEKPSSSRQSSASTPSSSSDDPQVPDTGRRRARSVAELHPLGQLRYIRPPLGGDGDNDEEEGPSSSSGRFSGMDDESAIDSEELAEMEVDEEDDSASSVAALSDIDEQEEEQDDEDDEFEEFLHFNNNLVFQHAAAGGHLAALHNNNGNGEAGVPESLRALGVPYQRYGHTVVEFQGKAYLWGGRNDEFGSSQLLHEYDPVSNKWTIVQVEGLNPPSRDGHTAAVYENKMYVFGGFEEQGSRFSQETYAFDFAQRKWEQLRTTGEPPQHRDFHTACIIEGRMYVFGGRSDEMGQFHSNQDKYCNKIMCLDLKSCEWMELKTSGEVPSGRRSHSVWSYDGCMYLFGGYLSTQDVHFNDLFQFNPATNHWRRLKPSGAAPSPRRRQCSVAIGSRVFLFGGTTPQTSKKGNNTLVDLSDLNILDFAPTLSGLCAEAILKCSGLREQCDYLLPVMLRNQLTYMSTPNTISKVSNTRVNCTNG